MSERTTGWHALLSNPLIYEAVQYVVGAKRFLRKFLDEDVRPKAGQRIIDIGCGPGEVVRFLPPMDYVGFDPSPAYIERATATFGDRARFYVDGVKTFQARQLSGFDIGISIGVLHHVDDAEARMMFRLAAAILNDGGRLVTADPCFHEGQNPINRFVVSADRGKNVRQIDAYVALARETFSEVKARIVSGLFPFPHSVCILECSNAGTRATSSR